MIHIETPIAQLLYRYARALDRLDMDLLESLFWPDAVIELGNIYCGNPAGFVVVARDFMGSMAATRHVIGNMMVEPRGHTAAFEAYVDAWHRIETPDGARILTVAARYIGEAAQRDGVWRLSRHAEVMDWGEERPADVAWFNGNGELPKGRRDRHDPSYPVLSDSMGAGA